MKESEEDIRRFYAMKVYAASFSRATDSGVNACIILFLVGLFYFLPPGFKLGIYIPAVVGLIAIIYYLYSFIKIWKYVKNLESRFGFTYRAVFGVGVKNKQDSKEGADE